MAEKRDSVQPERALFGRKRGRRLSNEIEFLLETLFPKLDIKQQNLPLDKKVSPQHLFDTHFSRYVFEIGFGYGDMLEVLHQRHPDTGFLACEPYINGVGQFLKRAQHNDLSNVRLWQDDALLLLHRLEDVCLDEIYILNPDPWPKKKHHRRRIVRTETLDVYARVLKPGGRLIMTTDVDDLAEWMVTECSNHGSFIWTAHSAKDWTSPPQGWITTKYERMGNAAGRQQTYLIFEKQ